MKGSIAFELQPYVPSDSMGTDYSNSADAALTRVMVEDLVTDVTWYDHK